MKYLIIGAGAAGINIASTLVKENPEAKITIISNEKIMPYNRIKISDLLADAKTEQGVGFYYKEAKWYANNNITLKLDTEIIKIDFKAKKAWTKNNQIFSYDKLFITTGGVGRVLPIDNLDAGNGVFSNIFYHDTKNIQNYIKLHQTTIKNVIIFGGGILGLETADALKSAFPHLNFVIFDIADWILPMSLDKESGDILQANINKFGYETKFKTTIKKCNFNDKKELISVITSDDKEYACQLCIIAAGSVSNIKFLTNSGLKINMGVIVDQYMQTNFADVYAAGDIIEFPGHMIPKLLGNALTTAAIAASTALNGPKKAFLPIEYPLSLDAFDLSLIAMGNMRNIDPNHKICKEIKGNSFVKFIFDGDKLIWGVAINNQEKAKELLFRKAKPF